MIQNKEEYIKGWTEMMITIWKDRMSKSNIHQTGALEQSFVALLTKAGHDTQTIKHVFNEYAFYRERGHGRGRTSAHNAKVNPNELAVPFLSKPYARSVYNIAEFLSEHYGYAGMRSIVRAIADGHKKLG